MTESHSNGYDFHPLEFQRLGVDAMRERVTSTTTGLLGLLGIDADPLQSRETILLSSILQHSWDAGEGLDLAGIIRAIQDPPFDKLGVFDLDTFYPAKERLQLAMEHLGITIRLSPSGSDAAGSATPVRGGKRPVSRKQSRTPSE